jgi:hypothetical protein
MINELTFREESPVKMDSVLRSSIRLLSSPRSPRVVEQIVVGHSNGHDSPVKQRIINFDGHLSKDLLLKLDERFLQT